MAFWRKKKEPDTKRRFGSFAFYFSIPAALFIAAFLLLEVYMFLRLKGAEREGLTLFLHSFLAGTILTAQFKAERLRTLIHEIKHVVVATLTGQKVMEVRVGRGEGHVTYEATKDTFHLEAFVMMAPYFVPLFSFPIFLCAIALESVARPAFVYALGFFYGLDLATGYKEIHTGQSDLKRIYGGYLFTRGFLFAVHLLWFSVILVWIVGGNAAFVFIAETLSRAAGALGESPPQ